MTDRPAGGGDGAGEPPEGDERDARLAALLSVDIGLPARPRPSSDAEPGSAFTAFPAGPDDRTPAPTGSTARTGPTEPPAPAPDAEDDQAHDLAEAPPSVAPRGDRRAVLSFAVLGVLLLSGLVLTYVGSRIVRDSTAGEVVAPASDPDEPGYEALVEATPTFVVFHDVGAVDSIAVLTLPDPDGGGGGVVLVPVRTVVEMPLFEVAPIKVAYDLGDDRFAAEVVGMVLGTAMEGRAVVDDARWADLVAPVAPITIDNPNELEIDGEVRFPLGEIELAPEDVGPYLSARIEGESDLARLFRHRLFWEAWLAAVGEDGTAEAVPGEIDTGIGRFVRTLAAGETVIETLPVSPAVPDADADAGTDQEFLPEQEAIEDLLYRLVPFPVSPTPGARARTRLLNGTPDTTRAEEIAAGLTPAGLEIVLVGNASSLDVQETTVHYAGAEFRDEAEEIVELLGVGEVLEETRPSDAADITVTLGADYE